MSLSRAQVQTATRNAISAAYIEQIETGAQDRPSASMLNVLAQAYQVDVLYLLKLARYLGDDVEAPQPQPAIAPAPLIIRGREFRDLTGKDLTILEQTAQRLRAAAASIGDKKVFTQDEVNAIVEQRLAQERRRTDKPASGT